MFEPAEMSPLTRSICWGFAIVNTLLGAAIAGFYKANVPLAVANILSYDQWGIVFFILGVLGIFALITNRTELVLHTQIASVGIKGIWLIALLVRSITAPQTATIALVWLFFTYIQIMVCIHFGPAPLGVRRGS